MAETQQQAEARLRSEYPMPQHDQIGAERVEMAPARYDDWIADSAAIQVARQLEDEAADALKELRRQVRTARARLQQIATASGTFTNAQRDAAIKDEARILDGLIGVLIDLNLIERED